MRVREVRRCVRLPMNTTGRDLVVGDLHGHRALFEQVLDRVGFDPQRDRVLSVGDLVDRGPDSLATLALIEEPWFHAVLGNHELMLLERLASGSDRPRSPFVRAACQDPWVDRALATDRKRLMRLVARVATLPLAIHVEDALPFNVMHGDLDPVGATQDCLLAEDTIAFERAHACATSRGNIGGAVRPAMLELDFGPRPVLVSPVPVGTLPLTYVGHSRHPRITVHNSYVYIDQGVSDALCARGGVVPPTVLEHRRFAFWLGGVATAHAAAPDRLPSC